METATVLLVALIGATPAALGVFVAMQRERREARAARRANAADHAAVLRAIRATRADVHHLAQRFDTHLDDHHGIRDAAQNG